MSDIYDETLEDTETDEEQGYNYPTIYFDGVALGDRDGSSLLSEDLFDLERIQVEFDATANGVLHQPSAARSSASL